MNNKESNQKWLDYARGYKQAALILFDEIKSSKYEDRIEKELIFPLFFNVRHTVELYLKQIIVEKNLLKVDIIPFDTIHEIDKLWRLVKSIVENIKVYTNPNPNLVDPYKSLNTTVKYNKIEKFISYVTKIDNDLYTFRYPENKNKKENNKNNLKKPINYNNKDLERIKSEFCFFCNLFEYELSSDFFFRKIPIKHI